MKQFPDESKMERSEDGSQVIRGGSVGFNMILDMWVKAANSDQYPRCNAVIISAFTVFRNAWTTSKDPKFEDVEKRFATDIDLFCEYFDTYLEHTVMRDEYVRKIPILLYFPSYKALVKDIAKEQTGNDLKLIEAYDVFYKKHAKDQGLVVSKSKCACFMIKAGGPGVFPIIEVSMKFKRLVQNRDMFYTNGDQVYLISHVPIDFYLADLIRNTSVLRSHTADILTRKQFHYRLDKQGRIPFYPVTHIVFGDNVLVKRMVTVAEKKGLLELADKENWSIRDEPDVGNRIAKFLKIPTTQLRKYRVN